MRKVELLPTRDCEAGYAPAFLPSFLYRFLSPLPDFSCEGKSGSPTIGYTPLLFSISHVLSYFGLGNVVGWIKAKANNKTYKYNASSGSVYFLIIGLLEVYT